MADREGKADAQPYHLVLLARDWTGYQNLCRIVTDAHLDGYYYKPRIDREYLARHARGPDRPVGLPQRRDPARARGGRLGARARLAGEYRDILGPGQLLPRAAGPRAAASSGACNEQLLRPRARRWASPWWPQRPALRPSAQAEAHDVLLCIGTASNLDTPNRMRFESRGVLPQDRPPRWRRSSRSVPEALTNTRRDRRDVRRDAAPRAAAPPALPGARRATRSRPGCAPSASAAWPRALRHRDTRSSANGSTTSWASSCRMGYAGYFLIVADFTRFAREQGIATTCRGSAPGVDRDLHAGHHAGRSDQLRPALRALPQPRPRDDARHRHGLRGQPAGRGHRLRHPQVRRRPRGPDHHLRHDAGPGRHPRRGPRPGHRLRRGRPHRQGRAQPARASSSTRPLEQAHRPAGPCTTATRRSTADRPARSRSRGSPATPPPTPPAWSSAASR